MMPAHPCDELLVHRHELQIGPVADAPVGCFDQAASSSLSCEYSSFGIVTGAQRIPVTLD
jgi:hypothetical protein